MKRLILAASVGALTAAGALAQDTQAQEMQEPEATTDEAKTLDQIVVQGTKLGLSVQEADVSVEVFDQVRLERENLFDLDDVLLRSPNVSINGNTNSLTIRGINRFGSGGTGVTSNIYIDGLPVASTALTFGLESVWDVAQVEVLRGPQSTVQGRNALAGAVVVQTADPSFDWELKGRARIADFGTRQYSGAVGGPIIGDQLAFRVAADYQARDGFIDNVNPTTGAEVDQDFLESVLVRSKLLFEPNALPDLRAEFIHEFVNTEVGIVSDFLSVGIPATDPAFQEFDPNGGLSFGDFQSNDTDITRLIGDISYDLTDNVTLKVLGTFEDVARDRLLGDPIDFTFNQNGFNEDSIQTYTGEVSLSYDFGNLSGNLGGYYFKNEEELVFNLLTPVIGLAPPGVTVNPADTLLIADTLTETDTENFAFYGQARYEFSEKWVVSLGLRFDSEEFNTTGLIADTSLDPATCQATVPGIALGLPVPFVDIPCVALLPSASPATPQADEFTAFLPRGSITYRWTEDISTFFAAQRGYRAGGTFLQQTTIDGAPVSIVGTFDPEFLTNFELGLRSQFLDRALTVNGTVFFSILEDQQVQLPGPTGGVLDFFTDNVGESEILGLELSVDYQPTDELDFYGSLGLLESEFTDFPFAINTPDSPFASLNGNTPPLAPSATFTVGGSYNHQSGLFIDSSLNFTGSTESDIANLREEDLLNPDIRGSFTNIGIDPATAAVLADGLDEVGDDRTTVNLRFGYRQDNFTISAFATNLFDDDNLIQRNFASVLANSGTINLFPNPNFTIQQPQTLGVQLDLSF
ncbi:MAG: TonB-dependent receptor [Pseudomonadota bacterium]